MLRNEPILFDAVDHDAYVRRPAVEEALVEAIGASRGVLLVGPSGSGRTTTLNWVAGKLPGHTVARVDAALIDTPAALPDAIQAGILDAVGGPETPGGIRLAEAPALAHAAETEPVRLQAMVRRLGGVHEAVILIDNLADPSVIRTVFGGLRELLWESKYTFVCSARPQDLPVFLAPPADSFFRRRVILPRLTEDELDGLIDLADLPADEARRRVSGAPRQPRDVIAAIEAVPGSHDVDAGAVKNVSPAAADIWRELRTLDRPVTVTDEELRLRSKLSPVTLRRHLNEL